MKRMILLVAVLAVSLSGCAAVMTWLEAIPDGERCMTINSAEKRVEICITKKTETVEKEEEKPEIIDEGAAARSESMDPCLDPLFTCYNYQAEELPAPSADTVSSVERLIGSLGFPIVICLILLYMQWKNQNNMEKILTTLNEKMDRMINLLGKGV